MFNWNITLILILASIPGVLVVLPRTMRSLQPVIEKNLKPGQSLPSTPVLVLVSSLQALVLVAVAAVVGTWLTPQIGISAPFFTALADGAWAAASSALPDQLLNGLWVSGVGTPLFLLAYYGFFRPRMAPHNVALSEKARADLGLAGRVLYGGIYEEVLTRWGLMTLCVWLFALFFATGPVAFWLGILASGVLFGLGHLPSLYAQGARRTRLLVATALFLNLWVSVLFGWLFWQVGLLSAMLAHMLFHLIWYPFDRRLADQGEAA